ncbi:MAG: lysophospholipid acyltransferase family protein [Candidatus Hydrogenedentes bacterium]|nr:lysophospholipid acyltransferase family protein [Candidatus Hydrogenedentota bacterium]
MTAPSLDYASSQTFSLKQRLVLATVVPLASGLLKSLRATCRISVRSAEHLWRTLEENGRALLGIWHETLMAAPWLHVHNGYHTLTSHSFDGEFAAQLMGRFGIKAVRGSSSRGALKALADLTVAAESVRVVGLTLDGPRGPRRVAKSGLAYISARTGLPIVPQAIATVPSWRMRSWDRLMIPKPFSKVIWAYGPPIPPPSSTGSESIQETTSRLQSELNSLHEGIEGELGVDVGL